MKIRDVEVTTKVTLEFNAYDYRRLNGIIQALELVSECAEPHTFVSVEDIEAADEGREILMMLKDTQNEKR